VVAVGRRHDEQVDVAGAGEQRLGIRRDLDAGIRLARTRGARGIGRGDGGDLEPVGRGNQRRVEDLAREPVAGDRDPQRRGPRAGTSRRAASGAPRVACRDLGG
jgi:hypothetical protein